MQGYFIVRPDVSDRYGVLCEILSTLAKNEIPEDQQNLYLEVEKTNATIKSLKYAKEDLKFKYFQRLLSIAQAGLVGEAAQPKLAQKSIEKLKEEMLLIEGPRIKNEYMKRLGITALIFVVVLAVAAYLSKTFFDNSFDMYCITFIGALFGTWLSYGARQITLKFRNLSLMEDDMMNPVIRLLYMGICSVVLLVFLKTNIITIEVGGISTEKITGSFELQFAIGAVCGLIESKIGSKLYKTAKAVFPGDEDEEKTITNNNVNQKSQSGSFANDAENEAVRKSEAAQTETNQAGAKLTSADQIGAIQENTDQADIKKSKHVSKDTAKEMSSEKTKNKTKNKTKKK